MRICCVHYVTAESFRHPATLTCSWGVKGWLSNWRWDTLVVVGLVERVLGTPWHKLGVAGWRVRTEADYIEVREKWEAGCRESGRTERQVAVSRRERKRVGNFVQVLARYCTLLFLFGIRVLFRHQHPSVSKSNVLTGVSLFLLLLLAYCYSLICLCRKRLLANGNLIALKRSHYKKKETT